MTFFNYRRGGYRPSRRPGINIIRDSSGNNELPYERLLLEQTCPLCFIKLTRVKTTKKLKCLSCGYELPGQETEEEKKQKQKQQRQVTNKSVEEEEEI